MKWLRALFDAMRRAKKAKESAAQLTEKIQKDGGLKLNCGCFVAIGSEALSVIKESSTPQELLLSITEIEESHAHV